MRVPLPPRFLAASRNTWWHCRLPTERATQAPRFREDRKRDSSQKCRTAPGHSVRNAEAVQAAALVPLRVFGETIQTWRPPSENRPTFSGRSYRTLLHAFTPLQPTHTDRNATYSHQEESKVPKVKSDKQIAGNGLWKHPRHNATQEQWPAQEPGVFPFHHNWRSEQHRKIDEWKRKKQKHPRFSNNNKRLRSEDKDRRSECLPSGQRRTRRRASHFQHIRRWQEK